MGALRVVWDHLEPYCYKANNDDSNFVAACHICNGIKTDLCFRYVEDARKYIRERIEVKGYRITEI